VKWKAPEDTGNSRVGYVLDVKVEDEYKTVYENEQESFELDHLDHSTKYDLRLAATNAYGSSDFVYINTSTTAKPKFFEEESHKNTEIEPNTENQPQFPPLTASQHKENKELENELFGLALNHSSHSITEPRKPAELKQEEMDFIGDEESDEEYVDSTDSLDDSDPELELTSEQERIIQQLIHDIAHRRKYIRRQINGRLPDQH